MKAYQWGWTPGFHGYNGRGQTTIDEAYLSGVAVTHGSPRQHIWSFVSGGAENDFRSHDNHCPCDTQFTNIAIPWFVGDDYTSVNQDIYGLGFSTLLRYIHSILMTHSGMVMDVTPVVPAAHSTILHISPNTLKTLPLNYDCVVLNYYMQRMLR